MAERLEDRLEAENARLREKIEEWADDLDNRRYHFQVTAHMMRNYLAEEDDGNI
jgi:hypothetical protein